MPLDIACCFGLFGCWLVFCFVFFPTKWRFGANRHGKMFLKMALGGYKTWFCDGFLDGFDGSFECGEMKKATNVLVCSILERLELDVH